MVKLTSVAILKYNGPDKDPFMLGFEADLSTFGYFQRGTVREMLTFVSRTVARKTLVGQRQTVQQEEYFCHVYNKDGLVGVAFVDHDYPARAGFCVVNKILEDYEQQRGAGWRGATTDAEEAQPMLEAALQKFQVRRAAGPRRRGGRRRRRRWSSRLSACTHPTSRCASSAVPAGPGSSRQAGQDPAGPGRDQDHPAQDDRERARPGGEAGPGARPLCQCAAAAPPVCCCAL
jgi:hypothetical protein